MLAMLIAMALGSGVVGMPVGMPDLHYPAGFVEAVAVPDGGCGEVRPECPPASRPIINVARNAVFHVPADRKGLDRYLAAGRHCHAARDRRGAFPMQAQQSRRGQALVYKLYCGDFRPIALIPDIAARGMHYGALRIYERTHAGLGMAAGAPCESGGSDSRYGRYESEPERALRQDIEPSRGIGGIAGRLRGYSFEVRALIFLFSFLLGLTAWIVYDDWVYDKGSGGGLMRREPCWSDRRTLAASLAGPWGLALFMAAVGWLLGAFGS